MNRAIVAMAAILVVGIPLLGILYFSDQYRDAGPSLPDRAIQAAEEAVRANPNSVNTRFALAEMYSGKGRYADAITQYDEILKAEPDSAQVLLGRGKAEMSLDKLDAAAADFQQVIDQLKGAEMANTDPNLEAAYYQLGSLKLQTGETPAAVDLLTKAVRMNRTDADALYLLGSALVKTGDTSTGTIALQRAVELVPVGWCEPYQALGQAYTAAQDAAGARYANGMVAFCQKRYDQAQADLSAVATGPHAIDALIGLGLLGEERMDSAAAAAAYEKALAIDPTSFLATTGLGRVSTATGTGASPSASASGGE